jgi:hypothetical protein
LWDLEAPPEKAGRFLRKRVVPRAVAFVGADRIVTAGDDRQLTVWDSDGKIVTELPMSYLVNGLAVCQDGRHLATANGNGTVYILGLPLRGR